MYCTMKRYAMHPYTIQAPEVEPGQYCAPINNNLRKEFLVNNIMWNIKHKKKAGVSMISSYWQNLQS